MKSLLAATLLSLAQPEPKLLNRDVQCVRTCQASEAAVDTISFFEGYSPFPYKDVAGYDTIGHGHLIRKGEKFKVPLLPGDAAILLKKDMADSVNGVNRFVRVPLWQPQFDALVSWTFNLGSGKLQSSTMLRYVNAKRHSDVPAQIKRWDKAGGKVYKGLIVRREAEAVMYDSAKDYPRK